jgi:hypothetical protein
METPGKEFIVDKTEVECEYLEIYNENIYDLLDSSDRSLSIRECPSKGLFIDGITKQKVE